VNLLQCTHPESDYGASFLLSGFASLGWNCVQYPAKLSDRGVVHHYPRPWHNNEEGCTGPLAWAQGGILPADAPIYEAQEIRSLLAGGFFCVVVVESGRVGALAAFAELEQDIRAAGVPVILLDGEDYSSFNTDAISRVKPTIYAKRELLRSHPIDFEHAGTRVVACPFSAPDSLAALPIHDGPFDYDCIFLAGNTHPSRLAVADALKKAAGANDWRALIAISGDVDRNLGVSGTIAWPEYIEALRRSRCGVSVRGHGFDTCRYWEVAVTTGLIADELDIHIPHPFEDMETAAIFEGPQEAAALIGAVKSPGIDYDEIRAAGIAHARRYHTNSARARYLLEFVL
jgi:hypothetical protein